jgi:hypothetical protein
VVVVRESCDRTFSQTNFRAVSGQASICRPRCIPREKLWLFLMPKAIEVLEKDSVYLSENEEEPVSD